MTWSAPIISDNDISWAAQTLGLAPNAFGAVDSDDERRSVFKELQNIDVAACPGSGKTTLLVAKLAALAQKWNTRTRGICVLSHTNVARNEVHGRLGGTLAGKRLLSYPHFIGTIHSFTNDFLALPWLRSKGYSLKRIDSESCLKKRWSALSYGTTTGLKRQSHDHNILQSKTVDCSLGDVRWGKGTLSKERDAYKDMQRVCTESIQRGDFTYEEMFIWANHLLDSNPAIRETIQNRFPIVFIDEAQDNSEIQAAILNKIFCSSPTVTMRQRFGDSNQAIYDSLGVTGAQTDPFPTDSCKRELKRSHRFGKAIARLASPLGVGHQAIEGCGPKELARYESTDSSNTIFLFDEQRCEVVLPAFADLLCEHFSEGQLARGTFSAVGQVHRPPDDDVAAQRPRHVGNYSPSYRPDMCGAEPKPATLLEYVVHAKPIPNQSFDSSKGVERIAQGIVKLTLLGSAESPLSPQRRCHVSVLAALENHPRHRRIYLYLVYRFTLSGQRITERYWKNVWSTVFLQIAEQIAGHPFANGESSKFLEWSTSEPTASGRSASSVNLFSYPPNDPRVAIRLGSIHSVKGETHTATLVLETFWHNHNLEKLLPWLRGKKVGGAGAGQRDTNRLKLHFVAMTRPSNLLCLAMKRSSFAREDGALDQQLIADLQNMGWRIIELSGEQGEFQVIASQT
jgi:DNA helicase II / ATP-dependent DNA helicase PcrA